MTTSQAETEAFGRAMWKTLRQSDCVLLQAPLGVGKTALARGLIEAAGHEGEVPSPSYAIVQPYLTEPPLYHLDLYRLNSPSELRELGIDDMLGSGVVVVEWPERADWWPDDALRVTGRILEDGRRAWRVERQGR